MLYRNKIICHIYLSFNSYSLFSKPENGKGTVLTLNKLLKMKMGKNWLDRYTTYQIMENIAFYLYLSSLASAHDNPYNGINSFTNRRTPSNDLTGSWEVGLVNIMFPKQINEETKNNPLYATNFKIHYLYTGRRIAGDSAQYLQH